MKILIKGYMTNDETFFVRMGGKRRDQIMLRL